MLRIIKELSQYDSYIVGGALRNLLTKRKIKDVDILICSSKETFSKIINGIYLRYRNIFPLDNERGIFRININEDLTIDISHTDDIEMDILKRDFTINSLLIELKKAKISFCENEFKIKIEKRDIIDIKNGIKDIESKKIKALSDDCIKEDALRILRAYRLSGELDFKIERKTIKLIKENKDLLKNIAAERIREELIKILLTNNSSTILAKMIDSEVLFVLIPQLKDQLNCATVYYGKGGVLKHTLSVIKRLDILYKNPEEYLNISRNLTKEIIDEKAKIKMAALLHDISKPYTAKIINNRLRFFGHQQHGSMLARDIMKKLRFSNDEIKYVRTLIFYHLRIGDIAHNNTITKKAILRIFYDLKEYTTGFLILSWADHSSYISEKVLDKIKERTKEKPFEIKNKLPQKGFRKTLRFLQVVNMIIKDYAKYKFAYNIKPLINGNKIMQILKIKPSREVGEIIKRLINLQIEGKIKNEKQAIDYVKTIKIKNLKIL